MIIVLTLHLWSLNTNRLIHRACDTADVSTTLYLTVIGKSRMSKSMISHRAQLARDAADVATGADDISIVFTIFNLRLDASRNTADVSTDTGIIYLYGIYTARNLVAETYVTAEIYVGIVA